MWRGHLRGGAGDRGDGEGGQRGGTAGIVVDAVDRGGPAMESVAIQGLRRRPCEIGVGEKLGEQIAVRRSRCGERAIPVERLAAALEQEIVKQGGGGAGIEGDDGLAIEIRHVRDAAEVEDHQRLGEAGGQRLVVERRERRPLPARGYVGVAEAVDHVDAQRGGHAGAAAELAGEAGLGLVEHGRPGGCGRPGRPARRRHGRR